MITKVWNKQKAKNFYKKEQESESLTKHGKIIRMMNIQSGQKMKFREEYGRK